MSEHRKFWEAQLNAPGGCNRLAALAELVSFDQADQPPVRGNDVNNHIHTTYSFSPYSPTLSVYRAKQAGLQTCGIVDHDSVAGVNEFRLAGILLNMPTTAGVELRVSCLDTPLAAKRFNNPDQVSIAFMVLHGIPAQELGAVEQFLRPVRQARYQRNEIMVARIASRMKPFGISLTMADVLAVSNYHDGGSITERHLLYALAQKITKTLGRGTDLTHFIQHQLAIPLSPSQQSMLTQPDNPFYLYDLLGILKAEFVSAFYEPASSDELPTMEEVVAFAQEHGIIAAYPYLGDVTGSVTGDKKDQTFEDAYLDDLFNMLVALGVPAITYMPSRNNPEQLKRIQDLCQQHQLLQISGEDINQPRQSFVCEAMRTPVFDALRESAWALIGHERRTVKGLEHGLFSERSKQDWPDLDARIAHFAKLGLEAYEKNVI